MTDYGIAGVQVSVNSDEYTCDGVMEYAEGDVEISWRGKNYVFAWEDGGLLTERSVEMLEIFSELVEGERTLEDIRNHIEEIISKALCDDDYILVETLG